MGERAKMILNEYSAKNILMRDTLDLDKFYTADLKLFVETARKEIQEEDKEIERLNNIIKEALILTENTRFEEQYASDEILLPILNKLRESGIRNYIKVEGSDKE